jgi:hypothetical protein
VARTYVRMQRRSHHGCWLDMLHRFTWVCNRNAAIKNGRRDGDDESAKTPCIILWFLLGFLTLTYGHVLEIEKQTKKDEEDGFFDPAGPLLCLPLNDTSKTYCANLCESAEGALPPLCVDFCSPDCVSTTCHNCYSEAEYLDSWELFKAVSIADLDLFTCADTLAKKLYHVCQYFMNYVVTHNLETIFMYVAGVGEFVWEGMPCA